MSGKDCGFGFVCFLFLLVSALVLSVSSSSSWCLGRPAALVCLFPLPLGVWVGLGRVIVALPGLFSYIFSIFI